MIKKIIGVKDPRIRIKSKAIKKIDKKVLNLIQDLHDTLSVQKDPEGVGLAAPQIGKNYRVFVARIQGKIRTFINPKIVSSPKKKKVKSKKEISAPPKIMEGCLSLPHFYGPLKRSNIIKISYMNDKGKKETETFKSFEAQIIRHEIDHLNGILFIDRLLEQKKPLFELTGDDWKEVELA